MGPSVITLLLDDAVLPTKQSVLEVVFALELYSNNNIIYLFSGR